MNVRAQVAMVFHLDKCLGCHTCSIACKNVWTDRAGAEYMWWNNVETKPGTGYPTLWEDQINYKGGWQVTESGNLTLRCQSKLTALTQLFFNPSQPELDDYYEPWDYRYEDLFNAKAGNDQPTAIPVSKITNEPIDIEAGPNWDDDLSGSPVYAENDPNLAGLTPDERRMLFEIDAISMMYLPRICNHCANPACVAACPSGAIYKRGEDGVVLINQDVCRGWRACVSACPYKKSYFNWASGKSEKCILCYPRLETGQVTACFHSCVGRIRYMGVLLYDSDRLEEAMKSPAEALVSAQLGLLLNPTDPKVIAEARRSGISDAFLDAARKSPVWKYVGEWKLALPLHPEFRTMPMLYYVPPLLPVMGQMSGGMYEHASGDLFASFEKARLPIKYLAALLSAGNTGVVEEVMRKLIAVRCAMRSSKVGDIDEGKLKRILREACITIEQAEEISRMTALPTVHERYVLPPIQREEAIEQDLRDAERCRGLCGFGQADPPVRKG